jgi:hypothetical protein
MIWKLETIILVILLSGCLAGCLDKQPVHGIETEKEVSNLPNSASTKNEDSRIFINKYFSEEQKNIIKQLDISSDLEHPNEVFSIYFSIIEEIKKNSTKVNDYAN